MGLVALLSERYEGTIDDPWVSVLALRRQSCTVRKRVRDVSCITPPRTTRSTNLLVKVARNFTFVAWLSELTELRVRTRSELANVSSQLGLCKTDPCLY